MMTTLLAAIALTSPTKTPTPSCCSGMAIFLKDPSFIRAHATPLPFKFQSEEGKTVSYSGHSGYYVAPGASKSHTAIVMVHEWWGLNDYIKREAVRLHNATGYAVLAVDLYNGKVATSPDEAGKLMQAVNETDATANVKDADDALLNGAFGQSFTKLGTIGWCFGGGWSLRAAIQGESHVKACVMYYGMPDDSPEDLQKLKAPVLMFEALQDKWISPEVVGKFKDSMKAADRQLTVKTYDADHGFANPSNPKYAKEDAHDAMSRSIAFFHKYLD